MTDLFTAAGIGESLGSFEVVMTFKAGGTIAKGDLVKMGSAVSGNIGTVVAVTGTGDIPIGVALKSASSGGYIPVLRKGVVKVYGSGAITLGTMVKTAAPGGPYVAATGTVAAGYCGKALQTFSDGDEGLILLDC